MPESKSDATFDVSRLDKVQGSASVLHKPGAVRLDGYPRLAHGMTPDGQRIFTEDNRTTVEDIARAFAESSGNADAVARRFGTSADHVQDAVRYAAATGFLAESGGDKPEGDTAA